MEVPGMSLFQGAGSIHINNSVQDRLDEQEEFEDQKRRHEELKNQLDRGFDDLLDDDDPSSVNSSANFTVDASQHGLVEGETKKPTQYNLPTYGESINHLKETQNEALRGYCETPKAHYHHIPRQDEGQHHYYSPYGAGDGQNNYCQQEYKGHSNGFEGRQDHQAIMNTERLQLMYEMRVKECQKLAQEKEEIRTQYDIETDSLRTRLSAAISDRDKADLSLQEAHHLLATSKHKMLEMEQHVTMLTEKLKAGEHDREQLKLELRSANISLQETQQRLHSMQVTQTHNTDALFRDQQDRHREELDRIQEELLKAKTRIEEKDSEIKVLEKRCKEKDREKEQFLLDKSSTINRLARELEAAQNQIANGETTKLMDKVSHLTADLMTARAQVKDFGSKLEVTAHELMLCKNKLATSQKEYENWRMTLQQIVHDTLPDTAYIGEPTSPGKLATLKDILIRYKQQTQKMATIQEELSKRDKKLELARKQESELRAKLDEQKGLESQLTTRLAVLQHKLDVLGEGDANLLQTYKQEHSQLQKELEELHAQHKNLDLKYTELELEYEKLKKERGGRASLVQEANTDLLRELERCSSQLKETVGQNAELQTLYLRVCSERDSKIREMKEIEQKYKHVQKENDNIITKETEYQEMYEKQKLEVEKLTTDLVTEREELERAKKRISELQKEFTMKQKEFNEKLNKYIEEEKSAAQKELSICLQCEKYGKNIKNLEEQLNQYQLKLATQESSEELIQELRNKADFFNKYILDKYKKLQELRNVGTNTEPLPKSFTNEPTIDKNVIENEKDDFLTAKTNLMMKEREIRDQIAEKFTLEIKTVEMNCSKKIKEMENEHMSVMNKLKSLLEKKSDEVETLKKFILSERTKITEILSAKENEVSLLIKENNTLQKEFLDLQERTTELQNSLEKALNKMNKMKLDCEKKSLDLSNEKEKSARNKCELTQKIQVLEARTAQIDAQHELLKEKYRNVKKTALYYKEYANKKDEHVENELGRIRSHYTGIVSDLQSKMQQLVAKRQQNEITERINKIQTNFNAMMSSDTNKPT